MGKLRDYKWTIGVFFLVVMTSVGSVFAANVRSSVHYNSTLHIGYVAPPQHFNPLVATNQQLHRYGFPRRPTSQKALVAWTRLMSKYKTWAAPHVVKGPKHLGISVFTKS